MAEIENTGVASPSAGEDTNFSKQAACHECRRSKVKCVRPLDATTCKKCANAGIECIVPKYHVGRYKGVKNKRSGLDKAIYQVVSVQGMSEIQPAGAESLTRSIEEESNVTVNNANNPLQLLAIASAIPEAATGNPSPASNYGVSPGTKAAASGDDDDTRDFFSPMTSKLDTGKDLDPQDLGLVSDQEVEVLFM